MIKLASSISHIMRFRLSHCGATSELLNLGVERSPVRSRFPWGFLVFLLGKEIDRHCLVVQSAGNAHLAFPATVVRAEPSPRLDGGTQSTQLWKLVPGACTRGGNYSLASSLRPAVWRVCKKPIFQENDGQKWHKGGSQLCESYSIIIYKLTRIQRVLYDVNWDSTSMPQLDSWSTV